MFGVPIAYANWKACRCRKEDSPCGDFSCTSGERATGQEDETEDERDEDHDASTVDGRGVVPPVVDLVAEVVETVEEVEKKFVEEFHTKNATVAIRTYKTKTMT